MKKLVLLVVLIGAAAAGGSVWLYRRVHEPYRAYRTAEQFVDLPVGADSRAIGERLVAAGVVSDSITFRAGLWLTGQGRHLKAGEYRFDQPVTPLDVIQKLARGDVYVVNLTFPEGLTIAEMAKVFEDHGFGPAAAFASAAADPSPVRSLDPAAPNLEGYLFPETYPLPRHVDASMLVRQMAARFAHVFTPELRQEAEAHGLSVRQAVTLA